MQSVSDDDVRKRLFEKPRFELAANGEFRLGRCYIFGRTFQVFGPTTGNGKARLPTVDRLTGGTSTLLVPVERSDRLPGRLRTGTSGPRRYGGTLPWRTLNVSRSILICIRSETRNQWRVANASVMWSADRRWKITHAAAFNTDCSRCTCTRYMYVGRPTSISTSISVVQSCQHQCYRQWLDTGIWPVTPKCRTTDLSEFSKGCKALRHRSLDINQSINQSISQSIFIKCVRTHTNRRTCKAKPLASSRWKKT